MTNKFLIPFFVITFLFQICFSFYYSSEIVNQNNYLNKNQSKLQTLKKENQEKEIKLSNLTSLNYLQKTINFTNLIPIKKEINLNQP